MEIEEKNKDFSENTPEISKEDELTQRHISFINHFVELGNATKAAKKAGYAPKGAHVTASRLLRNPKIMQEIKRINGDLVDSMKFRKESLLAELWRIGKSDPREAFTNDGGLKCIADMPDDIARSIKSIKIEELFDGRGEDRHQIGYTKTVQFHDKIKAIELHGREKGMFQQKIEVKVNNLYSERLKKARERVDAYRKRKSESGTSQQTD